MTYEILISQSLLCCDNLWYAFGVDLFTEVLAFWRGCQIASRYTISSGFGMLVSCLTSTVFRCFFGLWEFEAGSTPTDVATQVLGFSSRFQDTRLEAVGWLCSKVESIRTTQQGNFSIFWWQKSHETSPTAWNHVSIWCIYSIRHPYTPYTMTHLATHLLTCIPIKSTSQDSSSSLDALLCRVLWTLYGFSLKFISFSCNFYLQFVDPFVHFVPEVMLAKANARFVAQIFCTWRPEAKFQWNLVPAYQILAKELDDVIVHCQISFGQGAALNRRGIGHAFLSVRSYSKRRVTRRKRRARALQVAVSSWAICLLVGWTFQKSNVLAEVFHVHVLLAFHCHHGSGSLVSFGKVGRFLEGSCIRSICGFPADNRGSIQKEVFGRGRFQIKFGEAGFRRFWIRSNRIPP